ncbi:zinc-dependent alcohol dehydrogenase [Jiangella endophytica]|uniref:zinc-dependent alcohol dehydrogenase n=1 Tax=Jiangella endophytica TaxID=1623398 RepID=UPI001300735E|nr:alcohol dehydrogenase catalytic domain-containing protein [Jiangella endophytica]
MNDARRYRGAVISAAETVAVTERELAAPGPGEVALRPLTVGICGSDLHIFSGNHPFVPLPCQPGHEMVGVVDVLGPGAGGVAPGDRVVVEPLLTCGECLLCRAGRYNLCRSRRVIGSRAPGGMAEVVNVPAARLHPVPAGFSDAEAALVEPLTAGVHAVRMAGDVAGRRVAVLGAGSIGLMTLVAALAAGAAAVVVTDPVQSKRDVARRLGATDAFDPRDDGVTDRIVARLGERPDVILDCVSNQSSVDQAVTLAERAGVVVAVGVATGPVSIPLQLVQDRELRLEGTALYVADDVRRAIDVMAGARDELRELVTATYPLADVAAAFAAARDPGQIKVQVRVQDGRP